MLLYTGLKRLQTKPSSVLLTVKYVAGSFQSPGLPLSPVRSKDHYSFNEVPMKYLITGGAGFIGSHLAEFLLEQGHHVHVLDNLSTGSLVNIQHLIRHKNFKNTGRASHRASRAYWQGVWNRPGLSGRPLCSIGRWVQNPVRRCGGKFHTLGGRDHRLTSYSQKQHHRFRC